MKQKQNIFLIGFKIKMEQKEVKIGFWADLPKGFTETELLGKVISTEYEIFKSSLKKMSFTYELKPKILLSSLCDKKFNGIVTTVLKNDFSLITHYREPDENLDNFCKMCDNFYIYTQPNSDIIKNYIKLHTSQNNFITGNNFNGVINFTDINNLELKYKKILKILNGINNIVSAK